jgi:hypothetical protein
VIGFVPLLFVFAAVLWSRLKLRAGRQWRRGALEAAVLIGSATILGTELLGWLHRLHPAWIALAWVIAGTASAVYLWRDLRGPQPIRDRLIRRLRTFSLPRLLRYWSPLELVTLGLVIGVTGLVAWFSPPTNFDSMTYHLPRVMHWFQQGTLEHYPTSNVRQLAYGPGAAYWQVQLWSLFDGDLAANLPQWAALVGSAIALTLWLQRFFDHRTLAPAVLTALTLPMVLLQASSTQTDLLVGCWLLIAAVMLSSRDSADLPAASLAGLAIGLAVVTKPSAVLFVAPLAIVAGWRIIRTRGSAPAFRAGLLWVVVSLVVCLPHFSRNQRWFGQPLGHDFGTVVESFSPPLAAANGIRWLLLNIPSMGAWQAAAGLIESAGIDPNHPAISFREYKFSPPSAAVVYRLLLPDEDFAGCTVSLLLIALLALAPRARLVPPGAERRAGAQPLTPWLVALVAMLALNFVVLKWQVWGNRLLLPWTLFACPVLVAMTGVWRQRHLRMLYCGILLLQAAFVLTFSLIETRIIA